MRSHLFSAAVMLAAGIFLMNEGGMAFLEFGDWRLTLAAAAYAAGAMWWIVLEARATHRLWLHLIAVWLPATLPTWPLVRAVIASRADDTAALAVLLYLGPAGIALLASAGGAFVIFNRILWPKAPRT